ncbi:MAG: PilT/PilU family type 4a pilus ATPase [Oligosphaeraceae bacterium]|nr:PilT/PilU family type 4a pilus ATPase [Oligosphaeraceae bacterium]
MASILRDLLSTAVENNASDLHIREGKTVQLRIDSNLIEVDFTADTAFIDACLEQIVPPGQIDKFLKTGDLDFAWEEEEVGRFRVNLHKQRGLRGLTLRYVKSKAPTVEEVNLPPILKKIAESRAGVIFISGTTGSGKSTTMAAMLDHINSTMKRHIITIEDPIEYTFTDKKSFFEQREVGLDAESFDSALIHALRQDPDIIVIGEMRNRKTFETAMAAAETGHLVISTLHTKDAPQSVTRILDMFPMEERDTVRKSISGILRAIICQRLAPRAIGKGVVPVNEILINTPIVRKLIFDDHLDKLGQAIENGTEDNMMSFNSCLLKLVNDGAISEETALSLSDNPQGLKMNLKGIFLSGSGIIQ